MPSILDRFPRDTVLLGSSILLAFGCGALGGLTCSLAYGAESHPVLVVHASGAVVPTVTLDGLRDGALRGNAVGVRVYARDEEVTVAPDGSFAAVHPAFRIEEVSVRVPEGMAFVASKKGKKYYNVDSASGEKIAPQNRVYFRDSASAEAAGFSR